MWSHLFQNENTQWYNLLARNTSSQWSRRMASLHCCAAALPTFTVRASSSAEVQCYRGRQLHHQQPGQRRRWNNQPYAAHPQMRKRPPKIIIREKEHITAVVMLPASPLSNRTPAAGGLVWDHPLRCAACHFSTLSGGKLEPFEIQSDKQATGARAASMQDGWPAWKWGKLK